LASWVDGWYPSVKPAGDLDKSFSAKQMSVPGTTTLNLPGDWIAISDGELVRREQSGERTIEVWDMGNTPVARGFAAGRYQAAERAVNGRMIRIYLREDHAVGVDQLAELIGRAMAAQEARLGPFPFPSYGVVEVPNDIKGWGAASQQTFIMAKGLSFGFEHGNLPLWAHEMCHGWWGNTVGTRGPGSKMAGEALAQLGVLIALEAIEGRDAMIDFLENSRSGYSQSQCARGYFALLEQGRDHPLATLGTSKLSPNTTHNLVDSKGMWVLHMLRRQVGDEIFFGTLRELIRDYAGRDMALDDFRRAFVRAVPEQDLERFFAQWLDRAGAPRFDVDWSVADDERVEIVITQVSSETPFELDLVVEIAFANDTTRRKRLQVKERETSFALEAPASVSAVTLDPDRDLLIWRPAYEEGPSVDGVRLAATAPWVDPSIYLGTYEMTELDLQVEVYSTDNGMRVRVGDEVHRLWPHEPHRFRTPNGWVNFQVADGKARAFVVELDNGGRLEGFRLE
jgi:hypothetical protein